MSEMSSQSEMICQSFDASLLDALYGELDGEAAAAIDAHALGCVSCAARLERLKQTRELVRPTLETSLPSGIEERILARATATMDAPATDAQGGSNVVSLEARRGGIVALLSRPQFAIAAAFVLVLGATIVLGSSAKKAASSAERAEETSLAVAAAEDAPGAGASQAFAAAPTTAPPAAAASGAIALAEPSPVSPPAGAPMAQRKGGELAKAKGEARRAQDPVFEEARALYDAGQYAQALPKFQAIAAHDPEAELYVARCLERTTSCAAAVPHYDSAAKRSGSSQTGSRAQLEAARCLKKEGQATAARTRLGALTADPYVAHEASSDLGELTKKASVRAAPAATATAPAAKPSIIDTTR